MRRRNFLGYSLLFLAGCAASTSPSQDSAQTTSDAGSQPETLRLAVTDVQGLEELQRDYGAFRDQLETSLGRPVGYCLYRSGGVCGD